METVQVSTEGKKVAVIIACYNSEEYVEQTLESIFTQDYDDMEVLVVDDGSVDNTRKIVDKYSDKIRLLTHSGANNKGQYASLNLGLRNTTAEYIAFLDHDDLWEPEKLTKQVAILEKFPEIGVVYTNCNAINENNQVLYSFFDSSFEEKNDPGRVLLDCYIPTPSTVMVRRALLHEIGGFDERFIASSDHHMWVQLSEKTEFFYESKQLVSHRKHSGQLSQKQMRRMWLDGFKILDIACKRYPYSWKIKRKRLAVLYFRMGQFYWFEKHYVKGIGNGILAGCLDPVRAGILGYKLFLREKSASGL